MSNHQELGGRAEGDEFFQALLQESQLGGERGAKPDNWDYTINLNRKEIREHIADPKKTIAIVYQIDRYRYRCRVKERAS